MNSEASVAVVVVGGLHLIGVNKTTVEYNAASYYLDVFGPVNEQAPRPIGPLCTAAIQNGVTRARCRTQLWSDPLC